MRWVILVLTSLCTTRAALNAKVALCEIKLLVTFAKMSGPDCDPAQPNRLGRPGAHSRGRASATGEMPFYLASAHQTLDRIVEPRTRCSQCQT